MNERASSSLCICYMVSRCVMLEISDLIVFFIFLFFYHFTVHFADVRCTFLKKMANFFFFSSFPLVINFPFVYHYKIGQI